MIQLQIFLNKLLSIHHYHIVIVGILLLWSSKRATAILNGFNIIGYYYYYEQQHDHNNQQSPALLLPLTSNHYRHEHPQYLESTYHHNNHKNKNNHIPELNIVGEKKHTNFYYSDDDLLLRNSKFKNINRKNTINNNGSLFLPIKYNKLPIDYDKSPTSYTKFLSVLTKAKLQKSTPDEIDYNYYLPNPKTGTGIDIEAFQKYYYDKNEPKTRTNAVFPGTIWCGPGNKAPSDNSVGLFYKTDTCCRIHDKCSDTIPPNQIQNGLLNSGFFTRSHCDCDRDFYYCLRNANTFVSFKVGFAYFNILRPQCFREEHPIVECTQWYLRKCITYSVDESKDKIWQWFDNRPF